MNPKNLVANVICSQNKTLIKFFDNILFMISGISSFFFILSEQISKST
ncbi:hypothetical protein ADIS_1543 [Lunatimonas lonarensis]|uniref:Uncharacterized protein n=1 Tax=Lunatimonas lonarensis TaxID=1232681 RepID=R7ZVG1_9BACT|nr:hypothetical protein ADIS_1543 [Lunatimonas lonarensis]